MRLFSYNMHRGIGGRDRRYALRRIIDCIEHENPDLILLQEVDRHVKRSNFDDQARVLAEHFKAVAHLYQLNVKIKDGGYGNLLLSRWPLIEHHQLSLRMNDRKPRGAQVALIESPEGPFVVVNWHLGLAERERHWQVRHLLGHHALHPLAEQPTIIAGDYNDWRNTLGAGPLHEHGFRGVTSPPSRFRSFPAWLPIGSLDKAFVRGAIDVRAARIVRSALAHVASDHLPLVIDFHLATPA